MIRQKEKKGVTGLGERKEWGREAGEREKATLQDRDPVVRMQPPEHGRDALLKKTNTCCSCLLEEREPDLKESTKAPSASFHPPIHPPVQRLWGLQARQPIPFPLKSPLKARASVLDRADDFIFNCFTRAECKVKMHDTAGLGLSLKANQEICFSF